LSFLLRHMFAGAGFLGATPEFQVGLSWVTTS
jgi:hypothetical protein